MNTIIIRMWLKVFVLHGCASTRVFRRILSSALRCRTCRRIRAFVCAIAAAPANINKTAKTMIAAMIPFFTFSTPFGSLAVFTILFRP